MNADGLFDDSSLKAAFGEQCDAVGGLQQAGLQMQVAVKGRGDQTAALASSRIR
mgnify:CR=1 FL=1